MRNVSLSLTPIVLIALLPAVAVAQGNLPGFPKYNINDQTAAPLFFDFDRDGVVELLHANADHKLDIWQAGGVAFPGFPVSTGWHVWNMTPAVGDLDGDGTFEVVVAANDGKVHAFHADGSIVTGFPVSLGGEMGGAACLADLDGDGDLEILIQPRGKPIYALQGDGSVMPGWPVAISTNEGGAQTPAAGDIDNDGVLEIVATSQGIGSVLTVVHPDGSSQPGFPLVVTYTVGSPVLADLDRDGDLEIIAPVGSDLYAWHHDASVVAGFPADCGNWSLYTSPAVGDIDRDGYPEIVFGSQNDRVYVVRHDGTHQPGWPTPPTPGNVHATPCLVDLDFDGDLEILVTTPTSGSGGVYGWHHDAGTVAGFPWMKSSAFYGGVTLGDLNDDGKLDLAAAARNRALFAWTSPFDHDATRIIHGCYRVNRHNNAVYDLRPIDGMLGVSVATVPKAASGQFAQVDLRVANCSAISAAAELVLEVEYPQGGRQTLLTAPVSLVPGQWQTIPYVYEVPQKGPLGGYRLVASLWDTSAHVLHWDGALLRVTMSSLTGDMNCDGKINFDDIDPFVLALGGQTGYYAVYPDCYWLNGDIDLNGTVDFDDIDPFVKLLGG